MGGPVGTALRCCLIGVLGTNLGNTLKRQSVEVDWNLVSQGLKDVSSGAKTRLTEDDAKAVSPRCRTKLANNSRDLLSLRQREVAHRFGLLASRDRVGPATGCLILRKGACSEGSVLAKHEAKALS